MQVFLPWKRFEVQKDMTTVIHGKYKHEEAIATASSKVDRAMGIKVKLTHMTPNFLRTGFLSMCWAYCLFSNSKFCALMLMNSLTFRHFTICRNLRLWSKSSDHIFSRKTIFSWQILQGLSPFLQSRLRPGFSCRGLKPLGDSSTARSV